MIITTTPTVEGRRITEYKGDRIRRGHCRR